MTRSRSSLGLIPLILLCIVLLVPSLLAWLVNIEVALQDTGTPCAILEGLLPHTLYSGLTPFAADLSTISTLVPLLLLFFPLYMGIRIRALSKVDPGYLYRVVYDPYPPHFPFFLVMLGLTGTLYGLLIGLTVSGVSDLGGSTPTAGAIQETIDRLMGGTATALLSSLLGLIGAFLAARPLPWLFRQAAGIPEEETQHKVVEVVEKLTRDLQSLSHASREFSERLNVAAADSMNQRITQIETSLSAMAASLADSNSTARKLLELQEQIALRMDSLNHLHELQRLEKIESLAGSSSEKLSATNGMLETLRDEQEQTRIIAERTAGILQSSRTESQQSLDRITTLLDDSNRDEREDRGALRKALGHYIQNLTGNSE